MTLAAVMAIAAVADGQIRLRDETDRRAFRSWFTFLTDAQFYRPDADVTDCAGLVRHAVREALKPHTPEWHRLAALPLTPPFPDIRSQVQPRLDGWPLFRVDGARYAEFADGNNIVGFNTRRIGTDSGALRPGDMLYFRQQEQTAPDHLMVFVGTPLFERDGRDWIVYHTGPTNGSAGEVRKALPADLRHHPVARWRPLPHNPAFVCIYRLVLL